MTHMISFNYLPLLFSGALVGVPVGVELFTAALPEGLDEI